MESRSIDIFYPSVFAPLPYVVETATLQDREREWGYSLARRGETGVDDVCFDVQSQLDHGPIIYVRRDAKSRQNPTGFLFVPVGKRHQDARSVRDEMEWDDIRPGR